MIPTADKLHLGCGLTTPHGWVNLDGSWNAWFAKHPRLRNFIRLLHILPASQLDIAWTPDVFIHDVRKGLPFPDNSFTVIYGSHFLEHLYLREAQRLLGECCRVLKPGGVLRMVVPDLRSILLEYTSQKSSDSVQHDEFIPSGDRVNNRLMLRYADPPQGNLLYRLYNALNDFSTHKWMYDQESLTFHLRNAGFVEVEAMAFRVSRIQEIDQVEEADRAEIRRGICIEGIKPYAIG